MKGSIISILFLLTGFQMQSQQPVSEGAYHQRLDKEYCSPLFRTANDYMLVPMDDPTAASYFSVCQYLQGRFPGLMIFNAFSFSPFLLYRNGRPALYVDEMPADPTYFNSVPMADVAIIKLIRPPFIGAPGNGPGGALALYTKKGTEEE